jgi:L-lactate dehydrogenase
MKITIVGTGRVGSAIAFANAMNPIASELLLVNRSREKAEGDALDLSHASALRNTNMRIRAGGLAEARDADVIVFTASVEHGETFQRRSDLAAGNGRLLQEWIPRLAEANPDAIIVMVSNPVDALTYATLRLSGFPPERVIGTGTLLDSVRYRAMLSEELEIHSDDIRAYILGEHGDTQFAASSLAMTGGQRFYSSEITERIFQRTVGMGYQVAKLKGYTNYGIAMATMMILDSIVYDLRHTMPLSVLIEGFCGVRDVCLSLPAVVGRSGVTRVLRPTLTADEEAAFVRSADAVRQTLGQIRLPG